MADSPNLIDEQAELITRSKTLAKLTPEITKWFGDLNNYVRVMYNDSAELLRVLREAEKNFTSIEGYVHDIENYPSISGRNLLDFTLLHEQILDNTNSVKAKFGIEKSKDYITKLYPFLEEIYTTQFSKVSGNFQIDLKKRINGDLDVFRLQISARYKSSSAFESFIVYPYFVHILSSLLDDTFKLLTDLQEEAWKNLSEAKRAALKAERETLIQARQDYREEHSSSAVVSIITRQESRSKQSDDSSSGQTVSERAREVAEQYKKESLSQSVQVTIEQYLANEPSSRALIEMAAKNAALFEKVPTEYLELVRRELRNAPTSVRSQVEIYFNTLRLNEQAVLIALNGGKLPQHLDLDDNGDPKLRELIKATQGDVLQTVALLRGRTEKSQLSPEKFNKLIIQKFGVTRENIAQYEKESNAIADKQSEQYRQLQLALADERDILSAQRSFYEAQRFQQLSTIQRVEVIFNQIRKNPTEVVIDPESRIIDRLGFNDLSIPSDAQENFSSMDDGVRSSMLSGLRSQFKDRSKKDTFSQLTETKKGLKTFETLLKNPTFLVGAGTTAGAGVFILGIASKAAPLIIGGATATGAGIGFFIGGPVGALVGGGVGAVTGLITNSAIQSSLPFSGGGGFAQSAQILSQQVSSVAPATYANASSTLGGVGNSVANVLGNTLNNSITSVSKAIPAITSSGTGLPLLSATSIVAGPLAAVGIMTFIVTTSMSGSFITPNDGQDIATSRYVELTKVMDPDVSSYPDNGVLTPSKSIKYTLTLTPKKDDDGQPYQITIVDATDTISMSSKGKPTAPTIPPLDDFKKNATQNYTLSYDPSFADTRVSNVLSVKFTVKNSKGTSVGDASGEIFSTSATVSFGNPPDDLACLVLDGTWSDQEKIKLTQAFAITSNYPTYRKILCDHGSVTLTRRAESASGFFGQYLGNNTVVLFNNALGGSLLNLRYTLIHETGHAIADNHSDTLYTSFTSGPFKEGYIKTYGYAAAGKVVEDFPESIAVYLTYMSRSYFKGSRCINMATEYPAHFAWEQTNVFPEDIGKESGPLDPLFGACKPGQV